MYPTTYMKQTGDLSLYFHRESLKNSNPLYISTICLKGQKENGKKRGVGTDNTRMQIRALLEEINVSFHMGRKLHEMAIINEKIGVFDVMEAIFTCVFFHKVNFLRVESESYF